MSLARATRVSAPSTTCQPSGIRGCRNPRQPAVVLPSKSERQPSSLSEVFTDTAAARANAASADRNNIRICPLGPPEGGLRAMVRLKADTTYDRTWRPASAGPRRRCVRLQPDHLFRIPSNRALLEVAVIGEQRRTRCTQAERRILDDRAPGPHRVEKVSEMVVGALVPRRRSEHFIVAPPKLGALGIPRSIVVEERLPRRLRERVARLPGFLRRLTPGQRDRVVADRQDAVRADESENVTVAGALGEVHF